MRLLGAYLYAVICLSAALAAAAPAPPAGTDWERLAQVQQEARALDARDPDKALAVLYGLFRERPNLEPEPAVLACSDIVKLQTKAGRIDLATELCTWALNKYAWHPAVVCVAADQAEVLIGQQRFTEATDLLDRYWDRMALTYRAHSNRALRAYCAALAGDGRTSEIPLRLTRALREVPSLLDEGQQEPVGWIYNQLLFYLSPKDEELLRWARVRFAACAFDARSIERSVRMLLRVWRTHDPSGEPIRQFLAWQQGQGTRDPVSAVPLPSQDAALRKAQRRKAIV